MYALITLLISAAVVLSIKAAFERSVIKNTDRFLKIMSVAFSIVGILRYLLSDSFVETVFDFADPLQTILRWTYHISYAVLPMSVFFNARLIRNIASYFCLPISIVCALVFEDTFAYFMAEGAGGLYLVPWFRYCYYILELVLAISLPVLMKLRYKHKINTKSPKEILSTIGIIPLMMIVMMPAYVPQSIVYTPEISTGMFGELHLGWTGFLIAECLVLHFAFRKRSEQDKYMLLVFLVIAQMFHTNSIFLRGFTLSRLPLQLCSIAAFFYLYTIIKKDRKMFDFCFLSNLVGAAIALVLASFSPESMAFWNIHYIDEHSFVILIPILAMSLGLFPRLESSAIKHMAKYFTIYFVCAFIGGTIINGLDTTANFYPVNCFYMFDLERALSYVPFVGFTGLVHWEYMGFEMYPILVITIYVIFMLLNLLFYFMMRSLYKLSDKVGCKSKSELAIPVKLSR